MGSIEIIGIIDESYSFGEISVPSNANVLTTSIDNMNPINQLLFCLPIILCLLIPMIIKQKKYGLFNKEQRIKMKEENIKKYELNTVGKQALFGIKEYFKIIFLMMTIGFLTIPIHEMVHARSLLSPSIVQRLSTSFIYHEHYSRFYVNNK